jgi:hypothetical protein
MDCAARSANFQEGKVPSEEVLALHDSLLAIDTEHDLCRGIVVTVGDENEREESWEDVSADESPLCESVDRV